MVQAPLGSVRQRTRGRVRQRGRRRPSGRETARRVQSVTPLQEFLAARAATPEECDALYRPHRRMPARLLGVVPRFTELAHASPNVLAFYGTALRPCFHIPWIDLGRGQLSPRQRRMIILESSLAHGCQYCAGHCCAMGDLLNGSVLAQWRSGAQAGSPEDDVSQEDDFLVKCVRAVCSLPARTVDRERFLRHWGEQGWAEFCSVVCFMGWLNHMMAALCMHLEGQVAPLARQVFASRGLELVIPVDGDEERVAGDLGAGSEARHGLGAVLRNGKELVELFPSFLQGWSLERRVYAGVSGRREGAEECARQKLGFVPNYISSVRNQVVKEALAVGTRELLHADKGNAIMLYVFAAAAGNKGLQRDGQQLIKHCGELSVFGVRVDGSPETLDAVLRLTQQGGGNTPLEVQAEYAHACGSPAHTVPHSLQQKLVDSFGTETVKLAGALALFGMAHRALLLSASE